MPCRDNKDDMAMTGHKKIGKLFRTSRLSPYCLNNMKSDADTTAISPEPSFKQAATAAKAKAIATNAAAIIATAAPYRRYVVLRYLHCSKFHLPESGCKVNLNS